MNTPTPETAAQWSAEERARYEAAWLQEFNALTPTREIDALIGSENAADRECGMDRLNALAALCRVGGGL